MIFFHSSLELSIHSDISSSPHMLFFHRVTDSRSCSGLEGKGREALLWRGCASVSGRLLEPRGNVLNRDLDVFRWE